MTLDQQQQIAIEADRKVMLAIGALVVERARLQAQLEILAQEPSKGPTGEQKAGDEPV